ncbi:hypothetical protein BAU15_13325 [Enterococcus sp. JM4C]|uniref:endonuclease/exonuclease/phosphatase family protein n=1 Tax=Candidatus Enterococcus huntleyi TaxID=1857217 RepID=UPI00137AF9F7|nr:endonuclease/exonuclease/phosphatase family protein [Enterococcus sp. JM4C]KAF1296668.1 hypothetical protein BAU15_13325 [Enterococcus sp. JM4C]
MKQHKGQELIEREFSVATFNIAAANFSSVVDLQQFIAERGAEFVGLQEVDEYTQRNPLSMIEAIAGSTYSYSQFSAAMPLESGEYGNGLVGKVRPFAYKELRYSTYGLEPRTAQLANFYLGNNQVLTVCNTHLSFESAEIRSAQVEELLAEVADFGGEYRVIMGDFNMDQDKEEWQQFVGEYNLVNGHDNHWLDTFHKEDATMKSFSIDNIMVSNNIDVLAVDVIKNELSDHYMLEAKIKIKEGGKND